MHDDLKYDYEDGNTMELWRRIMETPGGVHTRSQTILMALEGLSA